MTSQATDQNKGSYRNKAVENAYVVVDITCSQQIKEILQAELSEIGFDAFLDTATGFEASLPVAYFNEQMLANALNFYQQHNAISWTLRQQLKENWNKSWEDDFRYSVINNRLLVRTPFHKADKTYEMELLIRPNMSFGTGHHPTTSLMLQVLLDIDFNNKKVLDIGCGTGILAIMAAKKGAACVDAFDIEIWAVRNTEENAALNNVSINTAQGEISQLSLNPPYQVVMANINKNLILAEMAQYVLLMAEDATLLISGFLVEDTDSMLLAAKEFGLSLSLAQNLEGWQILAFNRD